MRKITLICSFLYSRCRWGKGLSPRRQHLHQNQRNLRMRRLTFIISTLSCRRLGRTANLPTAALTRQPSAQTVMIGGTSIRTNSRIPIAIGSSKGSNGEEIVNQWQYQNVGVNIDAHNAREVGRQLSLELIADISSIATSNDASLHQPVIRQNKWQAAVLIPIGKATVVFTSDSLDSKGSMQVVVTATPLQ